MYIFCDNLLRWRECKEKKCDLYKKKCESNIINEKKIIKQFGEHESAEYNPSHESYFCKPDKHDSYDPYNYDPNN